MQSFNQFQQIDFTLSQSVQQLINLKVMLEEMAGQISGVTRQREGAVEQYEYVGNVQRSVVQSSTITESWFYSHAECKQKVLERLCNLMKVAWAGGKKAGMILGDGAYKFLNVMPDIALQDFGIYVGDSGKDDSMRQVVQQLSQAALQAGTIDMLGVIKVLRADTMTEAEKVLEQAMTEMQKQQEQKMEEQIQAQQAAAEIEQAKFQAEAQLKQMDNEAKLQVAQIGAESRLEVAKIQADVDRDLHDTKERNEMDKKAADYYIERKNREAELDREDKKDGEERSRTSGSTTSSESLKKAAQKI
jgi:D-ribose pyranose/furanose isomerase RbsD